MTEHRTRCKKCRHILFDSTAFMFKDEIIIRKSDAIAAEYYSCNDSLIFLHLDKVPDWVNDSLQKGSYTKGKLACPKCTSKIGGFDFISNVQCDCGQHSKPPVWVAKNRVDVVASLPAEIKARLSEGPSPAKNRPVMSRDSTMNACQHQRGFGRTPNHLDNSHFSSETEFDHNSHMFDTNCSTCRKEFLSAQRNYEFRGPVSHGNHIFDTSCDICRAEFMADQQFAMSVIEFQGNTILRSDEVKTSLLPSNIVLENHEVSNQVLHDQPELPSEEHHQRLENITTVEEPQQISESHDTSQVQVAISETEPDGGYLADTYVDGVSHANRFALIAQSDDVDEVTDRPSDQEEEEQEVPAHHTDPPPNNDLDTEALTCSVCLELFYMPHWCEPCQHVFCAPCLRRLRGTTPINTRCPLCRQVIVKCLPQHEMSKIIKALFPNEHKTRRTAEKRVRHQLAPLPGSPMNAFHFLNGRRGNRGYSNGAQVLAAGAGVCFVVLLMMLGFTVFATTVGFVLWYLVEISMDIICDLAMEINDFFDLAYQALVLVCVDGKVPAELSQLIADSASRMIGAFTKLVNKTKSAWKEDHSGSRQMDGIKSMPIASADTLASNASNSSESSGQFLNRMAQAQMANYVLLGFLVTYILYRFARHMQARRLQVR